MGRSAVVQDDYRRRLGAWAGEVAAGRGGDVFVDYGASDRARDFEFRFQGRDLLRVAHGTDRSGQNAGGPGRRIREIVFICVCVCRRLAEGDFAGLPDFFGFVDVGLAMDFVVLDVVAHDFTGGVEFPLAFLLGHALAFIGEFFAFHANEVHVMEGAIEAIEVVGIVV